MNGQSLFMINPNAYQLRTDVAIIKENMTATAIYTESSKDSFFLGGRTAAGASMHISQKNKTSDAQQHVISDFTSIAIAKIGYEENFKMGCRKWGR